MGTSGAVLDQAQLLTTFVPFVGAQGNADHGVGVTPLARFHVKEATRAEVARIEGNGQGQAFFHDGATQRGRIGFGGAGNIFSLLLANAIGIRSESALQLGVGSSVVMTMREIGYGPGTGYTAFGGEVDPLSVLEVGGEDSPEMGLRSTNATTGRRWTTSSWADGKFKVIDRTANQDRLTIDSVGTVNIVAGGLGLTIGTTARVYVGGSTLYFRNVADSAYVDIAAKAITGTGTLAHTGTQVGLYGVTPTNKAAAITTPTAPSAGYVQAEAAAMKTAVDAVRVALTNVGITA